MMSSRILIIEDDPTLLLLLQSLLEMEGYRADSLGSAKTTMEIITHIQQTEPALILSDICIGEINGFDLLRTIRSQPGLSQVCVLMSSGIDYQERCTKEKADGFILKPYMPDDLLKKIRCILRKSSIQN